MEDVASMMDKPQLQRSFPLSWYKFEHVFHVQHEKIFKLWCCVEELCVTLKACLLGVINKCLFNPKMGRGGMKFLMEDALGNFFTSLRGSNFCL